MRVVLVEDDADLRESVAALLEGRGFEVYPARDCAEAAAAARAWRPKAAVVDLQGTGDPTPLTGLGLALVLSSGSSDEYLAQEARRLGAVAVLRKPYDPAELVAALRSPSARPAA